MYIAKKCQFQTNNSHQVLAVQTNVSKDINYVGTLVCYQSKLLFYILQIVYHFISNGQTCTIFVLFNVYICFYKMYMTAYFYI